MQPLIALDQFLNTLVWAHGEGFGDADETLSARAWRLRERRSWGVFQQALDWVFFWDKNENGQRAHTYLSWVAEFERHHLPDEYRPWLSKYKHHHGTTRRRARA